MHRTSASLLRRVFLEGFTVRQLASIRRSVAVPTYRYRFRQALRRFVARPRAVAVPRGPLVLLADGLWFQFDGVPWVLYLTALKPCRGQHAVFLDPRLAPGKESGWRWQQAVAALPDRVRQRVRALVVDDLRGMRRLARRHSWVLQLCHFHLLLKLQVHRRGVRYALRGGPVREEIARLIRDALNLPDGRRLQRVVARLRALARSDCGTVRIQQTVREFLRGIAFYRSYRSHARLGLPRTTNAVESMGRLIRELFRSSRSGSNPAAVLRWATALIRMRPKIVCNGHDFNRKT